MSRVMIHEDTASSSLVLVYTRVLFLLDLTKRRVTSDGAFPIASPFRDSETTTL